MADATIRVRTAAGWESLATFWSLGIDATESGPDSASFVTDRNLSRFDQAEIAIAGVTVADGWIEVVESMDEGDLYAITVWCWGRALDDNPYSRTYFVSGFERALDARDGPSVNQAYWYRHGLNLSDRSISLGIEPNTIFYADQAAGVTFDMGRSFVGPRKVWLHQTENSFPAKAVMNLYVRAHNTRAGHHPAVAGQFVDGTGSGASIAGSGGALWRGSFDFAENGYRYLSVFIHTTATYDLAKDAARFFIAFDDVRISTLPVGGSTADSLIGRAITAEQVVPNIVAQVPDLTLGENTPSAINIHGLATDGHQTPRQMLERVNLNHWRARINPGRRLDRTAWPTLPAYTASADAQTRFRSPEKYSRVIVEYTDLAGDAQVYEEEVASAHRRSQVIRLDGSATLLQAQGVASAFMSDQAQRSLEGTVTVVPGQLWERPSGQHLDPSRLLLAGGDRVWLEDANDHARISKVTYDHEARTATVDLTDEQDAMDREIAHLQDGPT